MKRNERVVPFNAIGVVSMNETMKRNDIIALFKSLACSQGFYGRLLRDIDALPDDLKEQFWNDMEAQRFKDAIDVILYIEC